MKIYLSKQKTDSQRFSTEQNISGTSSQRHKILKVTSCNLPETVTVFFLGFAPSEQKLILGKSYNLQDYREFYFSFKWYETYPENIHIEFEVQ
jgi:hypothetical protein